MNAKSFAYPYVIERKTFSFTISLMMQEIWISIKYKTANCNLKSKLWRYFEIGKMFPLIKYVFWEMPQPIDIFKILFFCLRLSKYWF